MVHYKLLSRTFVTWAKVRRDDTKLDQAKIQGVSHN